MPSSCFTLLILSHISQGENRRLYAYGPYPCTWIGVVAFSPVAGHVRSLPTEVGPCPADTPKPRRRGPRARFLPGLRRSQAIPALTQISHVQRLLAP